MMSWGISWIVHASLVGSPWVKPNVGSKGLHVEGQGSKNH